MQIHKEKGKERKIHAIRTHPITRMAIWESHEEV